MAIVWYPETATDLGREERIAVNLMRVWRCDRQEKANGIIDRHFFRGSRLICMAEIKTSFKHWYGKYDPYYVDAHKVDAAYKLTQAGTRTAIVYLLLDGLFYFVPRDPKSYRLEQTGRTDRDSSQVRGAYLVPMKEFKELPILDGSLQSTQLWLKEYGDD